MTNAQKALRHDGMSVRRKHSRGEGEDCLLRWQGVSMSGILSLVRRKKYYNYVIQVPPMTSKLEYVDSVCLRAPVCWP